ncbi:MAG: acetate uptake transporter [Actinomycetota bacterium]|nr:acetate uptake transporter [Actinomycetota bacterium]
MSTTRQTDNVGSTPTSVGWGIADPGPLGLAGFAMTTFFLSVVNTNMVGASVTTVVLGLALFYGGLAQLLAGMWEFVKGNTFGAVAFVSFGAFWMSFWYLLNHVPDKASAVDLHHGIGLYLLGWAIFTAYMTIAATRVSGAVLAVFVFLTLTFIALAIGEFAHNAASTSPVPDGWTKLGGWLGLVTAAFAWYASLAGVMNATAKRIVFPTFPR